jgi:hypothetical protein
MAGRQAQTDKTRYKISKLRKRLTCLQIRLHHSRMATNNLTKIVDQEETDIVFIQEPYISIMVVGLQRSCAVFMSGEGRK